MRKQIDSLYGIRGIGIIIVFVAHFLTFYDRDGSFVYSAISIFIILSGFGYSCSHTDTAPPKASIINSVLYVKSKVKHFYWIHVLMFIVSIIYDWMGDKNYFACFSYDTLGSAIVNLLLLQSFCPNRNIYFGYNGVSWYLSTSLFFYFMAPWILSFFSRLNSIKKYLLIGILTWSIQVVITCLFLDSPYGNAILYVNPFFRCGDYLIGFIAGKIFIEKERKLDRDTTIREIIIILLFGGANWVRKYIAIEFLYSVVWTPICTCLIYEIAKTRGVFSRYLESSFFQRIGKNSLYLFLVHYLIIEFGFEILDKETVNILVILGFDMIMTLGAGYAISKKAKCLRR